MATAKIMLTLPTGETQHFEYSDMDAAIEAFVLLVVRVRGAEVAMTFSTLPPPKGVERTIPVVGVAAAYQPYRREFHQ